MMDDTDLPQMHEDFSRWYGAVQLPTDQSVCQDRWNGVADVAGSADHDDVEALIRLAFRTRQPVAAAAKQKICQAFKAADDTFSMQDNARELEVLASACLVALMDAGEDIGALAALAVKTTALDGARKLQVPMDLCTRAESAINGISEAYRQRPTLEDYSSLKHLKIDFTKAAKQVQSTQSWESIAKAFTLVAGDVRAAMSAAAQRQDDALQAVNEFVSIQDEELQMIWWLTGQRSWDYNCAFDAVPFAAQPLVFAKELADSTEFLPGPPSVEALLSRAGLEENKKLVISEAINAAAQEWLGEVVGEENPSPVSSPTPLCDQAPD